VLNRCGARTVLARETAETLADHDPPVLAATIGQRIAFAAAAQSGRLSELTTTRPPRARSRRWRMRSTPRHREAPMSERPTRRGFASRPPIPNVDQGG
jgi:hypothetical protein